MNVFISYSHQNQQEAQVIDDQLAEYNFGITRDSRELSVNKNMKEFMQKIKDSDYAVILISDSFLKSPNCMYEVLEFIKSPNYKDRLVPIITADAKIYDSLDISDYIEYWQGKIDELNEKLRSQKYATSSQAILNDLNHYNSIRNSIAEFIDHVRNVFHYAYDELKELSFLPVAEYFNGPELEKKN